MTNKNETFDQVCVDVIELTVVARSQGKDSMVHNSAVGDLLHNINERYLAAHKHELDDIREKCMHQATIIAEGKDAVIEDLKKKYSTLVESHAKLMVRNDAAEAMVKILGKDIAERDALINELAGALDHIAKEACRINCTTTKGKLIRYCEQHKDCKCEALDVRALVKKAREVAK